MAWRQAGKTFDLSLHGVRWEARLAAMAGALIREARACSGAGQRIQRFGRPIALE
jgi:hypothetical protein